MWGHRTRRQLIRKDGQDVGVGAPERNPLELGGGCLDDDVGLHAVRRPALSDVGRIGAEFAFDLKSAGSRVTSFVEMTRQIE